MTEVREAVDGRDVNGEGFRSLGVSRALWFAMLGGPFATAIITGVNYAAVSRACENESNVVLYVINSIALLIALAALFTAYRLWQRAGGGEPNSKFGVVHRAKFMAVVGLMSGSLAVLGILMEMYPILVMGACIGS